MSPWYENGAGSCLLTFNNGFYPHSISGKWAAGLFMSIYQCYSLWGWWHISWFSKECNHRVNFTWQSVPLLTNCGLKTTKTHWLSLLRFPDVYSVLSSDCGEWGRCFKYSFVTSLISQTSDFPEETSVPHVTSWVSPLPSLRMKCYEDLKRRFIL